MKTFLFWGWLGGFALVWVAGLTQTPRTQWQRKSPEPISWQVLETGLETGTVLPHLACNVGDNFVRIVRIDPAEFEFVLLSAKEATHDALPAPEWASRYGLIGLINAGMYQADHQTSVGFMQDSGFVNQSHLNGDNTILAFNRKNAAVPPIQLIDRTCQDWPSLRTQYHTFVQSIRMMDCEQHNRWSQQARYWSIACMGVDQEGRVLLVHSRTPWSVHDFVQILQRLDLDLHNLMYLEGGPEASLFLNHGETTLQQMGSYETSFYESDDNDLFWPIPNVIGFRKKTE